MHNFNANQSTNISPNATSFHHRDASHLPTSPPILLPFHSRVLPVCFPKFSSRCSTLQATWYSP